MPHKMLGDRSRATGRTANRGSAVQRTKARQRERLTGFFHQWEDVVRTLQAAQTRSVSWGLRHQHDDVAPGLRHGQDQLLKQHRGVLISTDRRRLLRADLIQGDHGSAAAHANSSRLVARGVAGNLGQERGRLGGGRSHAPGPRRRPRRRRTKRASAGTPALNPWRTPGLIVGREDQSRAKGLNALDLGRWRRVEGDDRAGRSGRPRGVGYGLARVTRADRPYIQRAFRIGQQRHGVQRASQLVGVGGLKVFEL